MNIINTTKIIIDNKGISLITKDINSYINPTDEFISWTIIPSKSLVNISKMEINCYFDDKFIVHEISLKEIKNCITLIGESLSSKIGMCIANLESHAINNICENNNYFEGSQSEIMLYKFITGITAYYLLMYLISDNLLLKAVPLHITFQEISIALSKEYFRFIRIYVESIMNFKGIIGHLATMVLEFMNTWEIFFIDSNFTFDTNLFYKEIYSSILLKNIRDASELSVYIQSEIIKIKIMQESIQDLMKEHQLLALTLKKQIKNDIINEIRNEIVLETNHNMEHEKKILKNEINSMLETINNSFETGYNSLNEFIDKSMIEMARNNDILVRNVSKNIESEISIVISSITKQLKPENIDKMLSVIIPVKVSNYLKSLGFKQSDK